MKRYARIAATRLAGAGGVGRLRSARAVVLGVGNTGSQVAYHLALAGVALTLVDRGTIAEENYGTQGFAAGEAAGTPKVEARARQLGALNPDCRIEPIFADVRSLGLGRFRHADALVCCLDTRGARVVVNEIATRLGKKWVDCAIDGSGAAQFGRVAAYDPLLEGAGCYLCPHDAASLRAIAQERQGSGCSALWWREAETEAPTLAVSPTGGAVAAFAALWVLRFLLEERPEIAGHEMYLDLDRPALTQHRLPRREGCLFDHRPFELTPLGRAAEVTLGATFGAGEAALGGEVRLGLERRSFAGAMQCPRCGRRAPAGLMIESLPACECGGEMLPAAGTLTDSLDAESAAGFLDRTWTEVGLPASDVVVASRGGNERHFLIE
jgi:hypothetical protein